MRYLVALLVLLSVVLMGQGYNIPFNPPAVAGGGGPTATFDDDHNTDHSDWVGYGITCTENAGGSGDLSPNCCVSSAQGACNFTGTAQPTHEDQWMFMEYGSAVTFVGPMLRSKNGDMTSSEYAYASRADNGTTLVVRVCDGDAGDGDCTTMGSGTSPAGGPYAGEGDGIIMGVANSGADTVICAWVIDVVGATDYCDSANWGNATYCISDTATPAASALDDWIDCGGDTVCEDWGTDGPTQSGKGYPAGTQLNVRAYSGDSSPDSNDFSTHTCGGTL